MTESDGPDIRVTAGPVPDGFTELLRLREELRTSEGWAIRLQIDGIQRTWNVFFLNWSLLDSMIGRFKSDTKFALEVFGSPDDRSRWDGFLVDLDVALHNFIASAATLADHTRVVAKRLLQDQHLDTYQVEVDRVYANRPRSRFVKDLRNYVLHHALPVTAGSFAFERGGPLAHRINLSVSALSEWKDWKSAARQYLDELDEDLDLHETLAAYYKDTHSFQKWFGRHVEEVHESAIAEANGIAERGDALAKPIQKLITGHGEDEREIPFESGGFDLSR